MTGWDRGEIVDQSVALLLVLASTLRARATVGFIDHHHFRPFLDEDGAPLVGLDVVDGNDLERVELIDRGVADDFTVEAGLGV